MSRQPSALRRSRGFTLLELLVVLVLAGITIAVVGMGGQAYMDRSRYSQAVRDVATQLNRARALSIQEGRPIAVAYQPEIRKLLVDGLEDLIHLLSDDRVSGRVHARQTTERDEAAQEWAGIEVRDCGRAHGSSSAARRPTCATGRFQNRKRRDFNGVRMSASFAGSKRSVRWSRRRMNCGLATTN